MESLLKRIERNRREHDRLIALILCLSLIVSMGTFAVFHKKAVAKTYIRQVLDCPYTYEGAEPVAHVHNDDCYNGETLVCSLPEIEAHTHTEECFAEQRRLTCVLEENPGHQHGDACYAAREEITCGLEENPGHVHNGTCFNDSGVLICTMAEGDGAHTHTADCFTTVYDLICDIPEGEGAHTHTDECYTTERVQVCGQEELPVHVHDAGCFRTEEITVDEPEETAASEQAVSTVPEMPVSDPDADLESAEDWNREFENFELSGNWARDLVLVAATQQGRGESPNNFEAFLNDAGDAWVRYGYTRYGAWYGVPYTNEWSAMFVSFCLRYAGIPAENVPNNPTAAFMAESFQKGELFAGRDYVPAVGDLIFFDTVDDEITNIDHMGIVYHVDAEDGTINTVEGDRTDAVATFGYHLDDEQIVGYGILPQNPNYIPAEEENTEDELDGLIVMTEDEEEEPEETTVMEEAAAPAAPMPAQSWERTAGGIKVSVEAPEGAFPENTRIAVTPVNGSSLMDTVSDAVNGEVLEVQAVDITFFDAEGREIEPAVPIRVVMIPAATEHAEEKTSVVHVDVAQQTAELIEQAAGTEFDNSEVVFDADAFTIYAIVYTVDFEYGVNGKLFSSSMPGAEDMPLSEIVKGLGIVGEEELETFLSKIVSVTSTNEEVAVVTEDRSVRVLKDGEAQVVITMQDGAAFSIDVSAEGETSVEAENVAVSTVNDLYLPASSEVKAALLSEEKSETAIAAVQTVAESSSYQAFSIALENVDVTAYDGFNVSVTLPEDAVIGKDFQLYQVREDGTATDLTESLTVTSVPNDNGLQNVSGIRFKTEDFADFVLSYSIETDYTAFDGKTFKISLNYGPEAEIPYGAELKVEEILPETETFAQYLNDSVTELGVKSRVVSFARFFDIEIQKDGEKIEPKAPVSVKIEMMNLPEETENAEAQVIHFGDQTEVLSAEAVGTDVSFETGSFSVYGVVYTVDFHYEINGQTFEFSIPGGGFISLEHLIEALGIRVGDADDINSITEEFGENSESSAETAIEEIEAAGAEEPEAAGTEENGNADAAAAYEQAIHLNSIPVTEETRAFVEDIETVEFSGPDLVWVGRAYSDTTVGALKEANRLACEYSADLTKEQIAEIDAQPVEAGDWALISLRPFISEESLTVTMKTGEAFTVRVTDAQLKTTVIRANGETWEIAVIYSDDAKIPKGAYLEAREVAAEEDDYQEYLAGAAAELDSDMKVTYARFFDIHILASDGSQVQPSAPVRVRIELADELGEDVAAVHFSDREAVYAAKAAPDSLRTASGDDGASSGGAPSEAADDDASTAAANMEAALIDAEKAIPDAMESAVVFLADGFSVYGIVVTELTAEITITNPDGEEVTYLVTVTYGPEAEIPEGAVLSVTEFAGDSAEYLEAYDAVLAQKLAEDDTYVESVLGLDAFDISILDADGRKVEPKAAVNVSVTIKRLPEGVAEADAQDTLEIQHLDEGSGETVVETVASAAAGSIQADAGSAQAEFRLDRFSTFTVSWNKRGTSNTGTTLRWRERSGNNYTARGFLNVLYADENGYGITRPDGIAATVDFDGFTSGSSHTFAIKDTLVRNIQNYTYTGAYVTDGEGNRREVTSVKGERSGEVTTITYYDQDEAVLSASYDATGQTNPRHDFTADGLGLTIEYESNNHTTVHYGYMENGVFHEFEQQPAPTETSTSEGWAYLIYDFEGTENGLRFEYEYAATYYHTGESAAPASGTAVAPVLRYNNNAWRYYRTSSGYGGDALRNNNNWTSVANESHLYVVYEKPVIPYGGSPTLSDDSDSPVSPSILKQSVENGDGTNTLSLSITGAQKDVEVEKLADVIVVLDLSSSMQNNIHNTSTTGSGYTTNVNSRYYQAKQAVLTLANNLYQKNEESGKDLIRMGLVTFAGDARVRQQLTEDKDAYLATVNAISRYEGKGTNWEQSLKLANEMSVDPGRSTFVIFITDGEPTTSQTRANMTNVTLRSSLFKAGQSGGGVPNDETHSVHSDRYYPLHYYLRSGTFGSTNAGNSYNSPSSFTAAHDDARSIVEHGKNFYVITISSDVGTEALSDLLSAAGVGADHGISATNQEGLTKAFDDIQSRITSVLGWGDIKMTDGITDLTNTVEKSGLIGIDGNFVYYKSSAPEDWAEWTDEEKAAYMEGIQYQGKTEYSEGYSGWTNEQKAAYQAGKGVSFAVWTDEQRAAEGCADAFYDETDGAVKWNMGSTFMLEDGVTYKVSFICWPTQEAYDWLANLANGTKTWNDVVEAGLNYPDGANPQIVNNGNGTYSIRTNRDNAHTTYKPATKTGETVSTSGDDQTLLFQEVEPMPLNRIKLNVMKEWSTTINTAHEADTVEFHILVDGKYYMEDGSFLSLTKEEAAARQASNDPDIVKPYKLTVGTASSWQDQVEISPGVIRGSDVLETGHSYSLEEYGTTGNDYYAFNYEFTSSIVRPMNIDNTLYYLVQAEEGDPATCSINGRTYYSSAGAGTSYYVGTTDVHGVGVLKGTNYKTSELDITKVVNPGNTNLTENDLNAESFTYRITLTIPAGSDISGITGYDYFEYPDGPNAPFKLFGYQPGETAIASDIARFGGKELYRSWNTTNSSIRQYLMSTDGDGNIQIKMDLTLSQKEVLRFTNLPTGTQYEIEEVYANYYQPASPSHSTSGQVPLDGEDGRNYVPSNLSEQGYTVSMIQAKNSRQASVETRTGTTKITGTISEQDTRYYNQFTNTLSNVTLAELKVTKHLINYEWSGERYYFRLSAGTASYADGTTGTSPMPGSDTLYLSRPSGSEDRTYSFGKVRYTRPGTYQYTITETDAAGNVLSGTTGVNGIAYGAAETVTVTVGYDGQGRLSVLDITGSNGNTVVSTADGSAVVTGNTTITNSLEKVIIQKVDSRNQTSLDGAVFEILAGRAKLYLNSDSVLLTAEETVSLIGVPLTADDAEEKMQEQGISSTFTIGEIELKGVALDTVYTLRELQPPEGYIISSRDVTFTLTRGGDGPALTVTGANATANGIQIKVENTPGVALPSTGGPGTRLFTILGSILILGAGVLLWRRRKLI